MHTNGRKQHNGWMVRVLAALLAFHFSLFTATAQDEPEYRMEVGAGVGALTYLGDFNNSLTKNVQPSGSLVAKYRMNPRMAVALTVGYGQIKGSSKDAGTWYPQTEAYSFSHTLIDAALHYECHFWAYGTGKEYRGAKRLTPFISLGIGMCHHSGLEAGTAIVFPLGAGVKYKLGTRLNLTAAWLLHVTTSDLLDGVKDPSGIQSSGLFKNTDGYNRVEVSLTYDIWAKCKTCNNDRF